MITLTPAMARDLKRLVRLYRSTVGTSAFPRGACDALRTGRALRARGLVVQDPNGFVNRKHSWLPTSRGIDYVDLNWCDERPYRD